MKKPKPKAGRITDEMRVDFLESRPLLGIGHRIGGIELLKPPFRRSIDAAIRAERARKP
jgi:hypothetical protein